MVNTGRVEVPPSPKAQLNDSSSLGRSGWGGETFSCFRSPGGGRELRCLLMSAHFSGLRVSQWALGGQPSGSQLSNGSVTALNIDVNVQLAEKWVVLSPETSCLWGLASHSQPLSFSPAFPKPSTDDSAHPRYCGWTMKFSVPFLTLGNRMFCLSLHYFQL